MRIQFHITPSFHRPGTGTYFLGGDMAIYLLFLGGKVLKIYMIKGPPGVGSRGPAAGAADVYGVSPDLSHQRGAEASHQPGRLSEPGYLATQPELSLWPGSSFKFSLIKIIIFI